MNADNAEFMSCVTARRQNRLASVDLTIGLTLVKPVTSVCDLGIFINSYLGEAHSRTYTRQCRVVL
jgi:hypothetical protein